jgi:hypothetical protein
MQIGGKTIVGCEISARVIHADGSVDDHGVVCRKRAPWWVHVMLFVRKVLHVR